MEHPGPDDIRYVTSVIARISQRYARARAALRIPEPLILRSAIAVGLLLAFYLAVLVRVGVLQLVQWPELEDLDKKIHPTYCQPAGPRGDILDAYSRVLATSEPVWAVKINPKKFWDKTTASQRAQAVELLAAALGKPESEIARVLEQDKNWAYLARGVSGKVRDRVRAAAQKCPMPTLNFEREYQRVYVLDSTACHIIGWRGPDQAARMGLEAVYDFVLSGQRGSQRGATDSYGRHIPWPTHGRPYMGRPARCVVTTLDVDIQHALEAQLDDLMRRYRPNLAMGAVLDVPTGEIVAMAARPAFNPNDFCPRQGPRRWPSDADTKNPATQVGFEPGSCLKPFVVAAALEEGLTKETEHFYCNGLLTGVGGPPIHCAHGARHGDITLVDVIARSCNVSAARLALRLGPDRLLEWLHRFGFGRPTHIELPEGLGLLPPGPGRTRIYPRDVACLGFGQGLSVTLIQLAAAYSALVNDGRYMLPHLVKEVINNDGSVFRRVDPVVLRRVCSAETSRRIRRMLKSVVDYGTGKAARIKGISVGGKTGTADRPKPGGGFEGYVSSFVMVLPVDKPQYVIAIVVDNPHGAHYGGVVAAPAAREVALSLLRVHGELAQPDTATASVRAASAN